MELQVGVKVLIRNKDGAFLFLRRNSLLSTDSHESSWDIPGGRINPEEQLIDALRREVKEEVGYDIQAAPQLMAAQDIIVPSKDLHVIRLTYEIEAEVASVVLSDEHGEYRWAAIHETDTMNVEPYLAEVLKGVK